MCGFVAILGRSGYEVDKRLLVQATERLAHRGPDDAGYFTDGNVGLGFRRLSILDLTEKSNQPFEDIDSRYVIVFNGEIYNYVELRKQLESEGHSFKSSGDTEVLLESYKAWGESCVSRFNGMWAFVIFDKLKRTIFGSRDRFGVKPLFVTSGRDRHLFASEIKAILAADPSLGSFNWRLMGQYLVDDRLSAPDQKNETMFADILEVPAGHCFRTDESGRMTSWPFWSVPDSCDIATDPVSGFRELFEDSVRLRLRSDVPVGVCLSGGVDSTAIICQMRRLLGDSATTPLKAFSYIDRQYDESEQIDATVSQTRAELYKLTNEGTKFLEKLEEVLAVHDEPLHSLNVLVSYELYRLAASTGVKVILNGQGADETWAGYPSYFENYFYGLLQNLEVNSFLDETRSFAATNSVAASEVRRDAIHKYIRNQLRKSNLYRRAEDLKRGHQSRGDNWFTDDFLMNYNVEPGQFTHLDLDSALRLSVKSDPLPLYLRIEDRNSMAHSIETRLPFMDYRLVELAFRTAPGNKLHEGTNKVTLRNAMTGIIPEIVRTRKEKMGFPVSAREWFAGPLYDLVHEVIDSQAARDGGVLNSRQILNDLNRHRDGAIDCSHKLFRVLQYQLMSGTDLKSDVRTPNGAD